MALMQYNQLKRHEVIALLGGAAAAVWPLAAAAQQDGRVGVLMPFAEGDRDGQGPIQTFRQGLSDLGWVEGHNLRIDVGWAGPSAAAQRSHAHDLVALAPERLPTTARIRRPASTCRRSGSQARPPAALRAQARLALLVGRNPETRK
jgi:hypothetical protein